MACDNCKCGTDAAPLNTPYEELVKFLEMNRYDANKLLQDRDPGCNVMVTFDGFLVIGPKGEVLAGVCVPPKEPVQVAEVQQAPAAPSKPSFFKWPKF